MNASAGSAASTACAHLPRRTDMNDLGPDRIGQADRPGNERYPCTGADRRLRNCMSLPPRRPVSEEPDRVDRLVCRARSDDDMPPAERTRLSRGRSGDSPSASRCQRLFDRLDDRRRLGHAGPDRILRRPSAPIRDRRTGRRRPSSRSRLRRVAGCSHILTFIAGAASTRLSVASSSVVARSSARPPAMRARMIRARRRDHDEVGGARQLDMADRGFVRQAEQFVADGLPAEGRRRKRGNELLRRRGHDDAHRRAAVPEPPDQLQRLVGRDSSADDRRIRARDSGMAVIGIPEPALAEDDWVCEFTFRHRPSAFDAPPAQTILMTP